MMWKRDKGNGFRVDKANVGVDKGERDRQIRGAWKRGQGEMVERKGVTDYV